MTAGDKLRESILEEMKQNGCEPDGRESEYLDSACAAADLIEKMGAELAIQGMVLTSRQGQPMLNPLITEVRQQRTLMLRFLGAIQLSPVASTTNRARSAAIKRWHGSGGRKERAESTAPRRDRDIPEAI